MGQMTALPNPFTSAIDALIFDLSTANAANPTELNAIGTVAGDLRLVHPTTATSDSATWYRLDASTDSVSAPYIMASATAGLQWIAIAGTYDQGNHSVSGTISGTQHISTIATGTAPFVVTSTTVVGNLNVSQLLGGTWASPGAIGGTTPGSAAHTTISATGQITSTLAGGTAPIVVTSTTVCTNLNAGLLNGLTWTGPGAIGGTTPATTFAASGIVTLTNTTSASSPTAGAVVIGNGTAATSVAFGGGNAQIGAALTAGTTITTTAGGITANNSTSSSFVGLQINNTGTSNAIIQLNASTGQSAIYRYFANGVQLYQTAGSATSWAFTDSVNSYNVMLYTPGASSAAVMAFNNTLAATSSTAASVKFAGGVAINAGLWISSATMISTSTSFTNGAGSSAGTLTNAPAVGNPTKWIPINDNGTTRYIPAW